LEAVYIAPPQMFIERVTWKIISQSRQMVFNIFFDWRQN
jgi:hypothetical protein